MRALAAAGDRGAAMGAYSRCCQVLRDDLDIEPDDETRILASRIEAGDTTSPPSTPTVRKPNLPAPLGSFVGREDELAHMAARLDAGARLVTAAGAGGAGKTRLALAAAWARYAQYSGGVGWVPLEGIEANRDPAVERSAVAGAVGAALGVTAQGQREPMHELATVLRDRDALLIVNNCEHLPEVPTVVRTLLEAAPHLRILATSREPLRLQGEALVWLGGLPVPTEDATDPANWDAVRLFLDRAARHAPGWGQNPRDVAGAARLCRLLDGLPLGIELVAHWVDHYTPDDLAEAIQTSPGSVTARSRDLPDRHQSLRSVFDYSWRRLAATEQRALKRLSVFRGSFDRAAAQAVAGVAVTTLSTLMDKSLLQRQGVGRYRIHELVRQFSGERSMPGTIKESIDDRHAARFLAFAEQAEQELVGARQAVWLESLRRDLDNLRAALTWFLRQGEIERGLRLAAALRMFWYHWGYWTEGQHWLEEGLARADGTAPEIRATALHALGMLVEQHSQIERATRLLDESLALFRELGDSLGSLRVLNTLGGVASRQGHYQESAAYYQQALDFCWQLGDRERGAVVLHNLAKATRFQGRFGLARERYEEALALHRELGHAEGVAVTLLDLGSVELDEDRFVEAESRLEESLGASRELGLQSWIAYAC